MKNIFTSAVFLSVSVLVSISSCGKDPLFLEENQKQEIVVIDSSIVLDTNSIAEEKSSILLKITDIKDVIGNINVAIYNNKSAYDSESNWYIAKAFPIDKKIIQINFDNIPPGEYGIAVYQDENKNNKLDQGLFSIPKEGFGFSNNATGNFSAPSYDQIKFTVIKGQTKNIDIDLVHY